MPKKAKSTAKSAKKPKKSKSSTDAQSVVSGPSETPAPSVTASPGSGGAVAASAAPALGSAGPGAGGRRPSATLEFNAGQLFERYDRDRDGYLDQATFARLCRDMGLHAAGPGGPSARGDPSRPSPRTSFDAGRLFQRYDVGNSGRLGKAEFDRFVQDYLVGGGADAGGYRPPPSYWGGADQMAPGYYPYQAPYQREYTPPWRTPTHPYPPSPDKEFEAGRLFERYDKNKSGGIERGEFERMVTELRHSGGRAAAPPVPPLAPRAHMPARAAWESPVGAIGMYGGHLSTMDAFRARMSDMTALTASLMVKREQMMQQLGKVQLHREHVKAARRAIERETIADAEEILHRLRSKEAFKLSLLQHDLDELRNDIAAIDRFHASFSAYQPRPTAGAMYSDVDAQTAMEFLSRYPELCGEADRLASKSVKTTVDVAVDDFERETAKRLHALQQFQAFEAMLEDRESVIAALDAEAEQARSDVQALQSKAKVEMSQMWKFSDMVVQKLESFRMQCEYCHTHLLDSTVNTECQVAAATSADGGASEAGAARHKWVKVAASQDSLLSWFG